MELNLNLKNYLIEIFKEIFNEDPYDCYPTGFAELDRTIGGGIHGLTVIEGDIETRKSGFAIQIAENIVKNCNQKAKYCYFVENPRTISYKFLLHQVYEDTDNATALNDIASNFTLFAGNRMADNPGEMMCLNTDEFIIIDSLQVYALYDPSQRKADTIGSLAGLRELAENHLVIVVSYSTNEEEKESVKNIADTYIELAYSGQTRKAASKAGTERVFDVKHIRDNFWNTPAYSKKIIHNRIYDTYYEE